MRCLSRRRRINRTRCYGSCAGKKCVKRRTLCLVLRCAPVRTVSVVVSVSPVISSVPWHLFYYGCSILIQCLLFRVFIRGRRLRGWGVYVVLEV